MGKIDFHNVHTMIGADAIIKGDVELKGGLIVYGTIEGSVTTDGPVRVAKTAAILGDVRASDIQIGGVVEGNIIVSNRVVLGSQSKLTGDLCYRRLLIEEGAEFHGKCDLTEIIEGSDEE
jgi:cytoskeletal protein CcmA (bactofilin family)